MMGEEGGRGDLKCCGLVLEALRWERGFAVMATLRLGNKKTSRKIRFYGRLFNGALLSTVIF